MRSRASKALTRAPFAITIAFGLLFSATTLRSEDPASGFAFEVGPAIGKYDLGSSEADLTGVQAGLKWELGDLLFTGLSLHGNYLHLESQDAAQFQRDRFDLDARFGVSFLGFLNPYVSGGLTYQRIQAPLYTPEGGWKPGVGVGGGVGITIIPKLLHTTPALRYTAHENLQTMNYSWDTALHVWILGVGVRVDYEDNLSRDGDILSGSLYATVRF